MHNDNIRIGITVEKVHRGRWCFGAFFSERGGIVEAWSRRHSADYVEIKPCHGCEPEAIMFSTPTSWLKSRARAGGSHSKVV